MNNPNLGYRAINGKDIYNEGLNMATAASARKFSKDTVDKYNAIKQGYGEDEAVRFLQNTSEFADLQNGLNKILESTDAPDKLKARVESYAMKGIMDGLKVNMDFSTPLQKTQSDLAWAKFDDDKEWRTSPDNPSYMVAKAKVASLNRVGSGSSKIPDNYIGQYSYVINAKGKTRILESDKKMKIPDPLTITSNNYDGLADWQKTLVKNALGLSKDSPNDKVREALENSIREFIVSDNEKAHKGKLSEENDIFTSIPKIKKTAPEEQEDINLDIE
jgi:hypothetical protein